MRSKMLLPVLLVLICGFTFIKSPVVPSETQQTGTLGGAWQLASTEGSAVKIYSDNFFMVSYYDLPGKKFIKSVGGTYSFKDGKYTETIEFNTAESSEVGSTVNFS